MSVDGPISIFERKGSPAQRVIAIRTSWLVLPAFFVSGFAALLYQMIWQRLLTLFGGADVYSVTIIVSAFMAGLGFGSLAGGHLADRLTLRGRLFAFAGAELAIALFAFGSVHLFHDVLYERLAGLALSRVATTTILFATLLWPTFFMGLSLPLLARVGSLRGRPMGEWIGILYGVNTLGAALGSLVTISLLARVLGFERAIYLGAALNLASAAGALWLALATAKQDPGNEALPHRSSTDATVVPPATFPFPVWMVLFALSGFIALSLEILWFRILGIALKSNSFTFAMLLALYLTGVGTGALLASRWSRRTAAPAERFLLLQSGITLYAGLSATLFVEALGRLQSLSFLRQYLGDYEAVDLAIAFRETARLVIPGPAVTESTLNAARLFLALYVGVPIFLVGIPTLLMGASFTVLQRATQTDPNLLGRRVGWLQTANIIGCTLGAIVTGLGLLQALGSAGTLRLVEALGGVFLVLLVFAHADVPRFPAGTLAMAAVAIVAWISPGSATLWAALHGARAHRVLADEDGSGLSVLKDHPPPEVATSVFVNGLGQSQLPYGGGHSRLGLLPVLLHPDPVAVAIIGLGSGDTVFSAGGRQETARIDCIEIVLPQLETLRRLERRRIYPGLTALLEDPRVQYTFTDGRAFLARGSRAYDVIEADALRPTTAYAGNLYSLEYFELMRARLKVGGFGVTWGPTPRILDTFLAVFPHVFRFDDILIGSESPIVYDRPLIQARLADPFTLAYYGRGGIDAEQQLRKLVERGPVVYGLELDRASLTDINTDLFPKDEYHVPQSSTHYR